VEAFQLNLAQVTTTRVATDERMFKVTGQRSRSQQGQKLFT